MIVSTGSQNHHSSHMDPFDKLQTTVAQCIEKLQMNSGSTHQLSESSLRSLYDLMSNNEHAVTAISCHTQTIPILVSNIRSGFTSTRNLAAIILEILARKDEMRTKLLLGGCIPPLLDLLKSGHGESEIVAARALYAVSKASHFDMIASKIFSTEGTILYLWEQLRQSLKRLSKPLDGLLTGTLLNLCSSADGFWEDTIKAGGLDILTSVLVSACNPDAQCHCCHLLAQLMLLEHSTCSTIIQSGCVHIFLKLMSQGNEFRVRAEAAKALKALSEVHKDSRQLIIKSKGIPTLMAATVPPCKEDITAGEDEIESLREHAMGALANISGGVDLIIHEMLESLCARSSDLHATEYTLGSLTSALLIFNNKEQSVVSPTSINPLRIEEILVGRIELHESESIQQRAIEALASLYRNKQLSTCIPHADVKEKLIILVAMEPYGTQQAEILNCFLRLCDPNSDLWHAVQRRQGIQLLISLLSGASSEKSQECALFLLSIMSHEIDESKWAFTAAGGIPPLVHILHVGSSKAKEYSAIILGNLCNHSEDILSCVKKSGAVPALLWMLRNTDSRGQEVAATMLKQLVSNSDTSTVMQLNSILTEDVPPSKEYIADIIGHLLSISPLADILLDASPVNESFRSLIRMLTSLQKEAQTQAACIFAKLLNDRVDMCQSPPLVAQLIAPLQKILIANNEQISMYAARCLAPLFNSIANNPVLIGDKVASTDSYVCALAERIIVAPSTDVQIGAISLLTCITKERHQQTMNSLLRSNVWIDLTHSLVKMLKADDPLSDDNNTIVEIDPKNLKPEPGYPENDKFQKKHSKYRRKNVALWLLCVIASYDNDMKCVIAEAGAMDAIIEELGCFSHRTGDDTEENGGKWISALLMAILFQDRDVLHSPAINCIIPLLADLLKSDDPSERYFSSQAIANLLLTEDRSSILTVSNSGIPLGLVSLLGSIETDSPKFLDIAHEFMLVPNPVQTALENLLRKVDIKTGSAIKKVIPALIELLTPSSDRPDAPLFAEGLLAMLATENPESKLLMAEAGILEALTRYLSLGPQHNMEECTADLLRILFSSVELRCHKSAISALQQLVALLHLGGKSARYSASRALQELFIADHIKASETARQAIPPLLEMLRTGSQKEQRIALRTLSTLSIDNQPKAMLIALDPESKCLEFLCNTLWADCSLDLKEEAAGLCYALFSFPRIRANPAAACCIEPLVVLAGDQTARSTWLAVHHALNNSFNTISLSDIAVTHGVVKTLTALLTEDNASMYEVALSSLVKLAKAHKSYLVKMHKDGADIGKILHVLPSLSDFACASAVELLQIMTHIGFLHDEIPLPSTIELLLSVLSRPGLGSDGQFSTIQILTNIIGNPQGFSDFKLSPTQPINQLITLLDSTSQKVQKLASDLFSHLLLQRRLEHSMITEKVILSLITLAATGMQRAVFALEIASEVLPQAVAELGGIDVVSKVIIELDPLPPHELWESAASVVYNVMRNNKNYCWKIPIEVLVRMLQSDNEKIILVALRAMLTLQKEMAIYAETFVKCGALYALTELLRCHKCEEESAQILEAILNDKKVRDTKIAYTAVAPLANYLLNPKTTNRASQLLSTLALGDLFQQSGITSSSSADIMLACRALVKILEKQSSQDIRIVSLSALQNIVSNSRVNSHDLVEAGVVELICKLLNSNNKETEEQATRLASTLFSIHAIPVNASKSILETLTATLGNNLDCDSTIIEEIIKSLALLFTNFPELCTTEAATHCIPHLIKVLSNKLESVQGTSLDILFQMRKAWERSTKEVSEATQVLATASAIPALQGLIKLGSSRLLEKASNLLIHLPGNLVVTIKSGKNLKLKVGNTNAFCKISLGNGPAKETKVVSNTISPDWNQEFSWPFANAPRGQKVQIVCKSQRTLSKGNLGKVTIQIDRVIAMGTMTGSFTLQPGKNRDGTVRVIEMEVSWKP